MQVYNGPFEPPPGPFSASPFQPSAACCWGCTNSPSAQRHPSQLKHKGSIYQYVLVTFRGQCCCSWTLPAGSQKYSSVSAGHYVLFALIGAVQGRNVRCWVQRV